ncbi:MvaI/BcnI family restriction endonuclease [Flexilinea flocculi]|uniref:MvaI/BcnI restriction endonuclease family n=1 Tax=Flexilinea flocculi TaxID=1678840 RepID=A0A0S7BJY8_9CHLR|nr:MvaI/BcnI family restriction endonuclease [Flexilinea flocculi]GAP40602.1 MvaI/BcnI restriction endonuclease family [Flexilinea flocculi]
MPKIYTKEQLIARLREIRDMGWVKNARQGNVGGVGNTLEDLLGIEENNLPIPNASEWELKCQRSNTTSLTTLFHCEPSPTALRIVPSILLLKYGWKHDKAGKRYPLTEMSFRQTISGAIRSDRGFKVVIDRKDRKITISFDAKAVDPRQADWLDSVSNKVGLDELNPQPYWGFDDIYHKAGTKLLNTFYVLADVRKNSDGIEFFHYNRILKLTKFSIDGWLDSIEDGCLYVDFDARTGHNHGTKFRLKQNELPRLYKAIEEI